jgi:hypothetical protein
MLGTLLPAYGLADTPLSPTASGALPECSRGLRFVSVPCSHRDPARRLNVARVLCELAAERPHYALHCLSLLPLFVVALAFSRTPGRLPSVNSPSRPFCRRVSSI